MDVRVAASETLNYWRLNSPLWLMELPEPEANDEGWGPSHAHYMLREIIDKADEWENDKANRWLGYAQGILVGCKFLTLKDCKRCNKEA